MLDIDEGASVTLQNNTFNGADADSSGDGAIVFTDGSGGDISLTANTITDFSADNGMIGVDFSNADDTNTLTVESNSFENNARHVSDGTDVSLDNVFSNNDFNKYAIVEDSSDNIQTAIFGQLDAARTEGTGDLLDSETVILTGEHTLTGTISTATGSAASDVTIRSASSAAAEDVVVTGAAGSDIFQIDTSNAGVSNINVQDLTLRTSGGASAAIDDNDGSNAIDGLTVENVQFELANDHTGIEANAGSEIQGVSISDNTFTPRSQGNNYVAINLADAGAGSGTRLSDDGSPTEAVISGNTISAADSGILVIPDDQDSDNLAVAIENNDIELLDNGGQGIDIQQDEAGTQGATPGDDKINADEIVIDGNTITSGDAGSNAEAVRIADNPAGSVNTIEVTNNDISNINDGAGSGTALDISASGVTVENNELASNALHFDDAGDNYDEQTVLDDNTVEPVVLILDEEGGTIQENAVYGTFKAGVESTSTSGQYVEVGSGVYEESGVTTQHADVTIASADGASNTVITTEAASPILNVDTDDVVVEGLTFNPTADNNNPDVEVGGAEDPVIQNNVFNGPGTGDRTAIALDTITDGGDGIPTVSDNTISGYALGVNHNDDGVNTNVVRNTITDNAVGIQASSGTDDLTIHFNDLVDNTVDVDLNGQDGQSLRANWWGDDTAPSVTEDDANEGDVTNAGTAGNVVTAPWLTESVDTLPTDQYVVVDDPRDRVAGTDSATALVAVLDDDLAGDADDTNTVLTADPSGPLSNLGTPNAGTGADAADPLVYNNIQSTETGEFTLTAQNTDGLVTSGSAVQTFVSSPAGVEVTADTETLVADDSQTANVTLQVVDENGNPLSSNNDAVSFAIDNSSDAGVNTIIREQNTDANGQAQLQFSADTAGVDVEVTGIYNDQGFSDSVTITTVEEAQANFSVDLVDGPTTITQNESFSATVNVTNTGDAAGTQDITYDLDDEAGLSQLSASQEISLDAGSSTEVTFEVAASDTNSLDTGNYTHVFASDDDELTVDAEVVAPTDSPLDGAAGEFDDDGDGTITASELGDAVNAFGQGNLTAAELGEVVNAFGQS